jgi:hypothetical protein
MLRRAEAEEAESRHATNTWTATVAELKEQQRAAGDY